MSRKQTLQNVLAILALLVLATATSAGAQETFDGWYNGFKGGGTSVSGDDFDSGTSWTLGYELGVNWQAPSGWLFGLDAYYDYNGETEVDLSPGTGTADVGSQAYGLDTKYGYAANRTLYYTKLGYGGLSGLGDADGSDAGFHGGLGIEHKFSSWSITGEWLYSQADIAPGPMEQSVENNNFTLGFNYYF